MAIITATEARAINAELPQLTADEEDFVNAYIKHLRRLECESGSFPGNNIRATLVVAHLRNAGFESSISYTDEGYCTVYWKLPPKGPQETP